MLNDVLAVDERTWSAVRGVLDQHARGVSITREEATARAGLTARTAPTSSRGSVAVIPLFGLLTRRGGGLLAFLFGGTALDAFTVAVRQAANDPNVGSILVLADSPGGEVAGTPEAADAVYNARASKHVVALVDSLAASASYWIASQASEVIASPSSMLGSIGVLAAHTDLSRAQDMAGVKTTLVTSARYKTERSPYAPLGDEAKAELQRTVNRVHADFVAAVARGRRVSAPHVESNMGQGRLLLAVDALKARMADKIGTLDATLAALTAPGRRGSTAAHAGAPATLAAAGARNLADARRRFRLHDS